MLCAVRNHHWLGLLVAGLPLALAPSAHSQAAAAVVTPPAASKNPPAPPLAEVKYLPPANAPALRPPPKRYVAPKGFAGFRWGERRNSFTRLPAEPAAVRAAWALGKERPLEFICSGAGMASYQALYSGCSLDEILRKAHPDREGGGIHVLSEYLIDGQGFKFTDTGIVLYPVVYEFCANWISQKRDVPKDFDELNKFCGMRLLFDTESRSQLAQLPDDHVTRYELVLAELIANYGKPAGFMWRGRVTLEPIEDSPEPVQREERKFSTWRWCPAPDHGLQPSCNASVILSIDPDQGRGIVLFATRALWQYAYAREAGDAQPDPLFTLMHALQPKQRNVFRQKREAERQAADERAARLKAARDEKAARKKAAKESAAIR